VPVVAGSSASNNHTTSTSARGLVPSIGGAGYIDTQTGSPTLGMVIPPNAAQLALVNAAAGADVALFHNVNLSTTRTAYDAGVAAELTHTWGFAASIRAEHKDGLKPLGSISRNTGGDISTIIPDLIDTNTEQVNSSLIYKGDKTSAQVAYYGSFFTNHVPSMSWQNWASGPGGGATMNTMSTTPDNTFHQFSGTSSPTPRTGATRRTIPSSRCRRPSSYRSHL
jgi:hypothetical protein